MDNIFIPKKIKVGFQNRNGTYTGKLAYVIYFDSTGKLRKEQSWQSWRDRNIEPLEYENTPQKGFVLNKGITRYAWSQFSSGRSMVRVYDQRGFEFEITTENLTGILTETICDRKEILCECVYAYCGKELVLLPCVSEEYQKAIEHTERQSNKITKKELKEGRSYTTKKGEKLIYVGFFDHFDIKRKNKKPTMLYERVCKKKFIFCSEESVINNKNIWFMEKSGLEFLSHCNNEEVIANYANILEEYNKTEESSEIEKIEKTPTNIQKILESIDAKKLKTYGYFFTEEKDYFILNSIEKTSFSNCFYVEKIGKILKDGKLTERDSSYYHYRSKVENKKIEDIKDIFDISIILKNGKNILTKQYVTQGIFSNNKRYDWD